MANKLQGCNDNVVLKHLLDLRKDVDSLTFALNQLYVSTTSLRTLVLDLPLGLGEYLARVLPVTDVLAIASVNTAFAHTFSKTISSRCPPTGAGYFHKWHPTKFVGVPSLEIVENAPEVALAFNSKIKVVPPSIKKLTFNTPWKRPLPPLSTCSLTHLTLGSYFNLPIIELPTTLTHLVFGNSFNQRLPYPLPELTHLIFGLSFNHPIDKIPTTTTHLFLGARYSTMISQLPQNLQSFSIGHSLNQQCNFFHPITFLPATLTTLHLNLPGHYNSEIVFPPNLVDLYMNFHTFTAHTTHPISLAGTPYLSTLDLNGEIIVDTIPTTITKCRLGSLVRSDSEIPPTTKSLALFGEITSQRLPESIKVLELGNGNEKKFHLGSLLLEYLKMGKDASRFKLEHLPNSLQRLDLETYELSLSSLPPHLTHLSLLNQSTPIRSLPNSITHLSLPNYSQSILELPSGLKWLRIGKIINPLPLPLSLTTLEAHVSPTTPTIKIPTEDVKLRLYTETATELLVDFRRRVIQFASP